MKFVTNKTYFLSFYEKPDHQTASKQHTAEKGFYDGEVCIYKCQGEYG